jgi:hypothetical protein
MINLFQRYRREDYDDDSTLEIIGLSMIRYRPQKSMKMPWAQRCDALLKLVSTLVPTLHSDDPIRAKVVFAAVDLCFEQELLHWLLHTTKGPLDGSTEYSAVHEAIHKRLLERDLCSMKLIVEKTKNLHLCAKKGYLQNGVETPTMLAMYDMTTFLLWRQVLRDLGHDTQEFVRRELEDGELKQAGWTQHSLSYLFDAQILPDPHTAPVVFGFPFCQRCGRNGTKLTTKLMVDLKWRRQLRDIRLRVSNKLSDTLDLSTSGASVVDNAENPESRHRGSSSTKFINKNHRGTSSTTLIGEGSSAATLLASLPYRIVCSDACKDGICVALLYENDSTDEPDFPLYPNEYSLESGETGNLNATGLVEEDRCPTHGMPGAFKD